MNCLFKLFLIPLLIAVSACSHGSKTLAGKEDWLGPFHSGRWDLQNAGKPYSITQARLEDRDSLRFEIRQGETWETPGQRSYRSEVSTMEFPLMESDLWYSFSVFLPKDFPIEDNRLVLAQWWAKTKKYMGEVNRSPILQLRFADGRLGIILRRYSEKVVRDEEHYLQTKLFVTKSFGLGRWNDFFFHVKWSPTARGRIQAWMNGKEVVSYGGITENLDDVGPVFKFGLYRDDSPKTYISFVSNVRKGDSSSSVGLLIE